MIDPPEDPCTESLRARIFRVLPAASFQMEKLLSLVDIVATEEVPTAAVECLARPRLLLNPGFVAAACRRDEHLFLLVMHELQHVVLGHTRLFPRLTQAQNIAFDAVINALLCRQFPGRDFTSFFTDLNPWTSFPGRLLRPPPGWPDRPAPLPKDATVRERRVHALLYGDAGSRYGQVTYHEVFGLLVKLLGPPRGRRRGACVPPTLLGDHGGGLADGALDESARADPLLRDVLRRIVEGWPPPPAPLAGRDTGRPVRDWRLHEAVDPGRAMRAALTRLLRRSGVLQGAAAAARRLARTTTGLDVESVLPQPGDRRAHAWRRLYGAPPVLWRARELAPRTRLQPVPVAHVYLDVSGSMSAALPTLFGALAPLHRRRAIRLYAFSTVIAEVGPGELVGQRLENTLGTDIACVLQHLAAIPAPRRPRRTLLLTDGYVGPVAPDAFERLGSGLFVGLYSAFGTAGQNDLATAARHVEVLPPLIAPHPRRA